MARDGIQFENGKHDLRVRETVSRGIRKEPTELQKIRRELLSISDRAVKLAARIEVLTEQQGQE